MSKLIWGKITDRRYDAGVDRGVLYPRSGIGVVWSGLMEVSEKSILGGTESRYLDGIKYLERRTVEEFGATIKAFTYPKEFEAYDGISGLKSSQKRSSFGLSYRTLTEGIFDPRASGYKIHLVYGVMATPSATEYFSQNKEADVSTFNWELSAKSEIFNGLSVCNHLIIDASSAWHEAVTALENILYGTSNTDPRLPLPSEVEALFYTNAMLKIIDHGDGSWTAIGPDDVVSMIDDTSFEITRSSAIFISEDTYTVSNY